MELKHINVPLSLNTKALSDTGEFEGHGSIFGNVDFGGDIVEKGAFTKSLAEWKAKGQLPLLPFFHNMKDLVGDWLEMGEDEIGLFVRAKLWVEGSKRIESAVKVHNLITGTGPKMLSIGYSVIESAMDTVDGKTVRRLIELKLFEVSVVPFGMNGEATITSAKSFFGDDGAPRDKRQFEKSLRDAGLSSNQAKTLISQGYAGLVPDRDDQEDEGLKAAIKSLTNKYTGK